MKYEHLNFIIQIMETQPRQHISNKYNTCTIVTSPVYIVSKFSIRSGVRFTKVFRTELSHKYILVECSVIALCLPVVSKLSRYKLVCYK